MNFLNPNEIELFDETLREGAERSPVSPTLEEKIYLARNISEIGIKSFAVGMFPDVPQNFELMQALLNEQDKNHISADAKFYAIAHVGDRFRKTVEQLSGLQKNSSIRIIAIHSVSDLQIKTLFPKIVENEKLKYLENWKTLSMKEMKELNLRWLSDFLDEKSSFPKDKMMLGLLDCFRADIEFVTKVITLAVKKGIKSFRLVDTAGTARPDQVSFILGLFKKQFPDVLFYCHFHDDFGLATANALIALSLGAKGVDVSVGGFANRAGHPALAEVVMSLKYLYQINLPSFKYSQLTKLSRIQEKTYGLIEKATQPITGEITHSVLTGIRTELIEQEKNIFDVIDPKEIGADLKKVFGIRSGQDGLCRLMKANESKFAALGIEVSQDLANEEFVKVRSAWEKRSQEIKLKLNSAIEDYYLILKKSNFTEEEVLDLLLQEYKEAVC